MSISGDNGGYDSLMSVFKSRRSCRDFKREPVPDPAVEKVMDAAAWTPSSHNSQNSFIIRVKTRDMKDAVRSRVREMMRMPKSFDPFYGAPEILVVVNANAQRDLAVLDGSMSVYNALLAASALGLGSCWVNTAQYETDSADSLLRKICVGLGINGAYGVGYIALGYPGSPAGDPLPRKDGRKFTV